ncbi:MAG: methyltransferase domain-containing protein, partial [Desulfobulbaceae bacterium]|nr:methyltransferase domain-containing protein [Desulfobulbaceae bacterium]
MDQSTRFWDKNAERYSKRTISDEAAYQKKLQVTREYFEPHMEVLELACGTGLTAIAHAPCVKHIRAIDISSNMLAIAQRNADTANVSNVSFEQASIEDLSVPDQTLDAVLGLSILHLLENKEAAIAKVHQMLKPGGVFVTSTICMSDWTTILKIMVPIGAFLGLMPKIN